MIQKGQVALKIASPGQTDKRRNRREREWCRTAFRRVRVVGTVRELRRISEKAMDSAFGAVCPHNPKLFGDVEA